MKTVKLYLNIPRIGKRIDVVVLLKGIVFCVEFKVGESKILEADIDQVLDYALDLKNFNKYDGSRHIYCATIMILERD